MKIGPTASPTGIELPPADVRHEPQPGAAPLPGGNDDTPEPARTQMGPGGLNLDATLQKAQIAILLAPGLQAVPKKAAASLKVLKAPDATLKQPKPEVVAKLNAMLQAARTAAESGTEEDRLKVDKVLQKTVEAYGIGQDGVTGLEFDPKFSEQGGTIGPKAPRTFIVIGKSALDSPQELASTILHESTHVKRNKELDANGIDRDKLGTQAEAVYSDLIEIEGYQTEINNARKLGLPADYVKGAENGKQRYLSDLKLAAGEEWAAMAEKGQFDRLHEKFRLQQLKKP